MSETIDNAQDEYGKPEINKATGKIKAKTLGDALMFPKYDCMVGVQVIADWDPNTKRYDEENAYPRLLGLVGGSFANFPSDPDFWREFAPFCEKMATLLDGLKIPERSREVKDDLDEAAKLLHKFNLG